MWKFGFLTLFLLAATVTGVLAQAADCPDIVDSTLKSVSDLCDALGRNSACYGANVVDSVTVTQPRPVNFFTDPGNYGDLAQFREIAPQPLDVKAGTFGAAVMNVQANLPNTIPGQGVIFLLMGDARLTNEVGRGSSEQTPFQSFYFLPGPARPGCYEAEPMLTIQTPGNISVTITLNGVQTEMSPSTLLTITSSVCTIHRGYITQRVGDDTANLLANQTVDIHFDTGGVVVVDDLRGISQREYERGAQVQDALNTLAAANKWPEQYVTAPSSFDAEPTAALQQQPTAQATTAAAESTCAYQYTVVPGDTLRKIATLYGTTVQALMDANHLTNPNLIYAGQALCIPAAGG